jgi:hypothetical protein
MQCYPKNRCGLPIGLKEKYFFRISIKIDYGAAQHQGYIFCLFLMNYLLCFNEMFLHTQESNFRPDGANVHCPFRVGGKEKDTTTVTTNNFFKHNHFKNIGFTASAQTAVSPALGNGIQGHRLC